MAFQRTLDQDFIDALNQLHDQPASWWRKLVDSTDVFLAIRNNCINAYSGGMSIGKIVRERRSIRLLVHEEYLTLTGRDPYVDLLSPKTGRIRQIVSDEKGYLSNLTRIKKRAGRFSGDERNGTNCIACRVQTVLDMEAAISGKEQDPDPENEKADSSDDGRMDLIVLTTDLRLLIIEAKMYANTELRAKGTPKVCDQLQRYHRFLSSKGKDLESAYRNVITLFGNLRGGFFEKRAGHASLLRAQSELHSVRVDPVPRLLVFGYDGLQEHGVRENAAYILKQMAEVSGIYKDCVMRPVGKPTRIKEYHFT